MRFFKIVTMFGWGSAPEDYCASPLDAESIAERIKDSNKDKEDFQDVVVEEVEKPPSIWLKRHIESMTRQRDQLSDLINLYKSRL